MQELLAFVSGIHSCILHDVNAIVLDRVLYSPERFIKTMNEAVKANSPFSLEDRIGLVYDALALTKAGYLNVSTMLSLYESLRNEEECMKSALISRSIY